MSRVSRGLRGTTSHARLPERIECIQIVCRTNAVVRERRLAAIDGNYKPLRDLHEN